MGTLNEDLLAIKEVEDTLVANKVARFAYTDTAYADNDADGVDTYDYDNEQNIPNPTTSVLKVNATVLDKGYRAQASSITRMLINHFFGRVSYNLNKINDNMSSLIATLRSHAGTANGFATLDSEGRLAQLSKSDVAVNNAEVVFTAKGAYEYTLRSKTAGSWLGKVFGHLLGKTWTQVTGETASYTIYVVYYADDLWLAGNRGNSTVGTLWSEDGKNWTQGGTFECHSIGHANGTWVAGCAGRLFWSTDGKHWAVCTGAEPNYGTFNTVCYGGGLWIAGGVLGAVGGNYPSLWWSEDGEDWTQVTGTIASYGIDTVYYANSLWVACSLDNGLWWSENGKDWYQGTGSMTSSTFTSVYYANGIWVASSNDNGLWWSTDGKDWNSGNGLTSYIFNTVYYGGGLWVAGGLDDGLWWSINGRDWAQGTGLMTSYTFEIVYYANGIWVAGSNSNGLWWSTNGKDWTQVIGSMTSYKFNTVCYGGGLWVAGSNGNGLWTSGFDELLEQGYFSD